MRICISGAQGTGKSTLLQALKNHEAFKDFIVRDETTRNVLRGSLGMPKIEINELGGDDSQRLIIAQHLANSINAHGPRVLYDRCALDGLVYTTYLYNHQRANKETLRLAESVFQNVKYDAICYIPPEFSLIDDGERSIDKDFQREIVELFEEYIESYRIPVARLTGTVDERVSQVVTLVSDFNKAVESFTNIKGV